MNPTSSPPTAALPYCQASRTLLLGELSLGEQRVLAELAPASRLWRRAANLLQAQQVLAAEPIQRVLLAQARPGQLPADTPQRVLEWTPQTELLSIAGDWCEGELRTGRPWEGVTRVYWHQLVTECRPEEASPSAPLVLVSARDYDSGSAWVDTLSELGYSSVWTRRGRPEAPLSGERLAVWDGNQLDGREAEQLAAFCRRRRSRGAAVVAVFDYPRADIVATALEVGAKRVLGRPWTLDLLQQSLTAALHRGSAPVVSSPALGVKLAA